MRRISALIVDDERLSRKRIRRLLAEASDIDVAGECGNGQEAVKAIEELRPDLLFLDIQMPGLDGFGVLQAIGRERQPMVIFITAYDDYAVRAFDVHAFDYLLKPFDRKRFEDALARARAQMERSEGGELSQRLLALMQTLEARRGRPERIAVKSGGNVVFVKLGGVDWIEAADNYVCLHCGPDVHTLRETMNALEGRLDPGRFVRIHRSTIVNVDRIKSLQPWFRGDWAVLLQDGTQLTLSRSYREKLKGSLL
jgi:two-component system LytT family response regulator